MVARTVAIWRASDGAVDIQEANPSSEHVARPAGLVLGLLSPVARNKGKFSTAIVTFPLPASTKLINLSPYRANPDQDTVIDQCVNGAPFTFGIKSQFCCCFLLRLVKWVFRAHTY